MKRMIAEAGAAAMVIAVAVFVVSCGVGTPLGVSGFSKGVITAKGSIFVNGVEFNLTGTSIMINGVPGTEADLKKGMQVEVRGRIDDASKTGRAMEVDFDSSLKGPISNVPVTNLVVLGQTVNVDVDTVFESPLTGIGDLAQNDVVEVAGLPDGSGAILATHIEKTGSSTFEISGTVGALGAGTFTLTPENNGVPLTVNFSGALAGGIANGSVVEVKFSTFAATTITTTAANVKTKVELEPEEGVRAEVEGFVTNLSAPTFMVDGISVNAGSLSLALVSNGTRVEVEGSFTSGVLYAEKIVIK